MPTSVSSRSAGLATHASRVALGPSRALTSRVRNFYLVCYHDRCRRPRATFLIDASLLLAAAALIGASLWFAFAPVARPPLSVTVQMEDPRGAAPVPVTVTARSLDGKLHRGVHVRWQFPPGTEVLDEEPSADTDGWVFLGDVGPDTPSTARAVVRLFLPPGSPAPFYVTVRESGWGAGEWSGADYRLVGLSALVTDVPEAFQTNAVTSEGAVVPVRIANTTNEPIPSVELYVRQTNAHPEERLTLGDLNAGETRWAYLSVTPSADTAELSWVVSAVSREITEGSWKADVREGDSFPEITLPVSRPDGEMEVALRNVRARTGIAIVHPLLEMPVQERTLPVGSTVARFPSPISSQGPNHEWLAASILMNPDGTRLLGPATMGITAASIPFTTQVRYLSTEGDPLGAGPHPPQVGVETRYWVFWNVGPTDADVRNVRVDAKLAPGVTATGNISGADGGAFSVSGSNVSWTLPRITPETGSQAFFAFEISVTPTVEDVGRVITLIGSSSASVQDTHSALRFESADAPHTTHLVEDADRPDAGVVQPHVESSSVAP